MFNFMRPICKAHRSLRIMYCFNHYHQGSYFNMQKIRAFFINKYVINPLQIERKYMVTAVGATQLGAAVNLSLAIVKGITGTAVGSTALIADAVNNLGDLVTDVVVYFSITQARKKACNKRPWGNGKLEPLGALVVGSLVIVTGAGIGMTSVQTLHEIFTLAAVTDIPIRSALLDYTAVGVSITAIVSKEALFHYTMYAGKKNNSASVIANAWQHRADAFISSAALLGFMGSMFGHSYLDPLAAVFLSTVIIKQGLHITADSIDDLRDAPVTPRELENIRSVVTSVKGIDGIRTLLARRSGPYMFVECVVYVDSGCTVEDTYLIVKEIKDELRRETSGRLARSYVEVYPTSKRSEPSPASQQNR